LARQHYELAFTEPVSCPLDPLVTSKQTQTIALKQHDAPPGHTRPKGVKHLDAVRTVI
jgi:hypothetical protein